MRSSRASSSGGLPPWLSRKAWERDLRDGIQRLLAGGFLIDEDLLIADSGSGIVTLEGFLSFEHRLSLEVGAAFQSRGNEIRMVKCSYHAAFGNPHLAIFRYDDAHSRPGHPDRLHKHVFDPPGAPEPGIVQWIGRDNWPTLFDVVSELQAWWETTGCRLQGGGR